MIQRLNALKYKELPRVMKFKNLVLHEQYNVIIILICQEFNDM